MRLLTVLLSISRDGRAGLEAREGGRRSIAFAAEIVLTIPRVLRGLFQRERRLLGLLARSARDAIVPSISAVLDRRDETPGVFVSIENFGSNAANFHPHVHALVTDGAWTEDGCERCRTP